MPLAKELPRKLLYDERGSRRVEQITELDEYYPTHVGPDCLLIEYGSGSSEKTRLLLDRLRQPAGYIPIDISKEPVPRPGSGGLRARPRTAHRRRSEERPADAFYNPVFARVEMHLVSLAEQLVRLGDIRIHFQRGESIWTEASSKYSPPEFATLAADDRGRFSVRYLNVAPVR